MKTSGIIRSSIICIASLALAFFIVHSCEQLEPGKVEPGEIDLEKKSAQIVQADQQFAFELFREVCAVSEEENIMISPLSVSYALGMTYNGAAGATLDAFIDVLHFDSLTNTEVNETYKYLMGKLVQLDDQIEFSIANSIWYRIGFQVLEEFINTNREYFDAAVEEMDFSDPGAVDIINSWIEEKTNDKIQDMLDYIPADAVMYLINAIYFNATWKYQFDSSETYEGDFNLEGGGTHTVSYMKLAGAFCTTHGEYFTAVELPYGDSTYSMVVMLPEEGTTAGELAAMMDHTDWDSWFSHPLMSNDSIELPRFKYGFRSLLNDPLTELGLGVAFTGAADFSRIRSGGGIYISRVIHQTFIDVQEEGTEAAAATIVEMRDVAVGPPTVFKVNRPFLYVIKENSTGAIVFMGKVGRPDYS